MSEITRGVTGMPFVIAMDSQQIHAAEQGLLAVSERLNASLSAPESVTAEPAADYDSLRKQFLALRTLANSNARMVSHWRNQCGIETREALLANADNVNAERVTNQMLTDALLAAEEERDQLKAENEALRKDGERYRWLRQQGGKKWADPLPGIPAVGVLYDIAVDAVMTKEGK